MALDWRPVAADDVPAWLRLLDASETLDRTGEHYDLPDLHEELRDPATGRDDRIAAFDGSSMVAYGGVRPRVGASDHVRIDAECAVNPARRGQGLGTALVEWIIERSGAIQSSTGPHLEARIHSHVFLHDDARVALLAALGFRQVNWSALMRTNLQHDPRPSPTWPDGLTLHTYDRGWSDATRLAHNAAFADHWGFAPWTPAMWAQWVDDTKNTSPELSWVLTAVSSPDAVVGYVISQEYEANAAVTGRREAYLAKFGVLPELRGRGLGAALLSHALREYTARGFDESALDVDTENRTGAFGLYERAGFTIEARTATFERVIAP